MCGIVGCILKQWKNGFDRKQEESFFNLLYVDALRGFDSTGLVAVERDSSFHIAKEAVEAADFIPAFKCTPIVHSQFRTGLAYIGHNRKKTIGKVDDESAHPFVVDNRFAMVHNGTLRNHEKLAKTKVDSEALAIVLDKAFHSDNQQDSLEETLGLVDGAYAIAAYSQELHKVWLLRNNERPLCLFETDDAYYFGSEALMLQWILSREYLSKDVKYKEIAPGDLLEFDLAKGGFKTTTLVPKKAPPPVVVKAPHTGGAADSGAIGKIKEPTAKDIKRLRKTFVGRRVAIDIEQVVETNFPRKWQMGETEFFFYGTLNQGFAYHHYVTGDCDIRGWNWDDPDVMFPKTKFSARVESITLDDETLDVVMHVADVKPYVKADEPARARLMLSERLEFATKLSDSTDAELLEISKSKNTLTQWQEVFVQTELRTRADAQRTKNANPASLH